MFDENALILEYPTNTQGDIGNIVNADSYRVLANNVKNLTNTAGYNQLGQGNSQPDMDLLPKDQLSKAVSSYSFLANKFDSSFASGLYALTSKTLNTGNLAASPYLTPGLWQDGMKIEFTATNTNIGDDVVKVNNGPVYPILKTVMDYQNSTLVYRKLILKDILQNENVTLVYSSTANQGNAPAFILEKTKNAMPQWSFGITLPFGCSASNVSGEPKFGSIDYSAVTSTSNYNFLIGITVEQAANILKGLDDCEAGVYKMEYSVFANLGSTIDDPTNYSTQIQSFTISAGITSGPDIFSGYTGGKTWLPVLGGIPRSLIGVGKSKYYVGGYDSTTQRVVADLIYGNKFKATIYQIPYPAGKCIQTDGTITFTITKIA